MIWSKYNIFFQKEGEFFLYNSLSNSFARLDENTYLRLKDCFDKNVYPDDDELIDDLRKMKVIDVDEETEILRLRYNEKAMRLNFNVLSLTINPTLSCNFRCPYCFEKDHPVKFMTDEVEDDIVNYVSKASKCELIDVTWFGGEPLLAFDRIKSLTNRLMNIGKKYSAGMITNGYLLTEEVSSQLSALKIRKLQITIDGPKDIHDTRRFLAGGGATFDRIVENIRNCQRIAPEIHIAIRVNIDPTNKERYIELYNYFKNLNLPNVTVYPGFVSDKGDTKSSECSSCNKNEAITFLIDLYNKHGIKYIDFFPSNRKATCVASSSSGLVIGPEGETYKCWNDVGDKTKVIGYINGKITNPKVLYQYLEGSSRFDDKKCVECILLPICNGGCPHSICQNRYENGKLDCCPDYKDNLEDFLYMHYIEQRKNKFKKSNQL